MLSIETVKLNAPVTGTTNCTVNVTLAEIATEVVAGATTLRPVTFMAPPVTTTLGVPLRFKAALPLLVMV